MAQSHQHYCPNCGTPAAPDERFCNTKTLLAIPYTQYMAIQLTISTDIRAAQRSTRSNNAKMYNIDEFRTLLKQPCVEFQFANIIRYMR